MRNVKNSGNANNNNNARNRNAAVAPDCVASRIKVGIRRNQRIYTRNNRLSRKRGIYAVMQASFGMCCCYAANGENMEYEDVLSFESLYQGFKKCKLSASWKDSVAIYNANALKNTLRLKKELLDGTYRISPYNSFVITDPKRREVKATQIRDRQFQHALCDLVLYDDLTEHFIYDNCACQKGKGVDFALNRMAEHLRRYYRKNGAEGYILKCDIRHYFAETSHSVAKAAVRKRVKDDGVYNAVCKIIDSFGGDKGIGLGSQVSQLVQLAVLDDLDHFIKERLHIEQYIRYMDDFVLIHKDKVYLNSCKAQIEQRLAEIGLALNRKTQIFPIRQGVRFLKWKFNLTDSGRVLRTPDKKSIYREKRKLKRMKQLNTPAERAAISFLSWASAIERGKAKSNNAKRKLGKIIAYTPCSAVVEDMRKLFIELFGADPYRVDKNKA